MSKALKTKQFIIEKTAPVFNQKGFAGTSLSDLTAATGLTKGAIYGNFENKDEIAIAAFDHNVAILIQGIREKQETKKDTVGKLLAYVEFYRTAFENEALLMGCPLVNMATEADDTHPILREKVKAVFQMWQKSVEKLVQQGIDEWKIRRNINPHAFSCVMISMIQGGMTISKATGDHSFLNSSLDRLETWIRTEVLL